MRRTTAMIMVVVLVGLCMGGTCRQETSQAAVGTFLNAIAQTAGQAVGDALLNGATP